MKAYCKEQNGDTVLTFLSSEMIENQMNTGKVGFGEIYSDQTPDLEKFVENALQCFRDGMIRVYQGDMELTELQEPLIIQDGDIFTLIRLTFLTGRLW